MDGRLDGSIHEELQARGATITGYLGNGVVLVYGREDMLVDLNSYEKVVSVQERLPQDKISKMSSQEAIWRRGRRLDVEDEHTRTKKIKIIAILVEADVQVVTTQKSA